MAKVPNGIETFSKISIAWVGCMNVTDRETDGQAVTYAFAKNNVDIADHHVLHLRCV